MFAGKHFKDEHKWLREALGHARLITLVQRLAKEKIFDDRAEDARMRRRRPIPGSQNSFDFIEGCSRCNRRIDLRFSPIHRNAASLAQFSDIVGEQLMMTCAHRHYNHAPLSSWP